MASIYDRMRAVSNKLLDPARFGQGIIRLVRYSPGPPPADPWGPPAAPTRQETTLKAAARGVSARLVGTEVAPGVQVQATDLQVIAAPGSWTYEPGDVLEIDGKPLTVLRVDNIPAAGTVSAIRFIVRN